MSSCQKEALETIEPFNIDSYTGRYNFDIELITEREGTTTSEFYNSIGYVTKESDYTIKVLFDFYSPNVNCVYEYAVRPDGSFYSLYGGAGERTGGFADKLLTFTEIIDFGSGNYKKLDVSGVAPTP